MLTEIFPVRRKLPIKFMESWLSPNLFLSSLYILLMYVSTVKFPFLLCWFIVPLYNYWNLGCYDSTLKNMMTVNYTKSEKWNSFDWDPLIGSIYSRGFNDRRGTVTYRGKTSSTYIIVLGAENLRYSIGKMMPISYCKVKFSFCFLQNLPKM